MRSPLGLFPRFSRGVTFRKIASPNGRSGHIGPREPLGLFSPHHIAKEPRNSSARTSRVNVDPYYLQALRQNRQRRAARERKTLQRAEIGAVISILCLAGAARSHALKLPSLAFSMI